MFNNNIIDKEKNLEEIGIKDGDVVTIYWEKRYDLEFSINQSN